MSLESDGPIQIYRPSLVAHPDVPSTQRHTGYITDLRLKTKINSLAETPLPEFELGASKTAKLATIRELEYFSPRYNLEILLKRDGGNWLSIFEFAIHNRRPFFVFEVLGYLTRNPAFAVAPDAMLGLQFVDVGHGLPTYGLDQLHLYGLAREEYSTPDPPIIIQSVLPANPSEEIDMATLTAVNAPLTIGSNVYNSSQPSDQYSSGLSYRLLAWESLKIAQLDFTLNFDYPSQGSVILSWEAKYSAGSKKVYVPLVFIGTGDQVQPNGWCEIQGNELIFNSNMAEQPSGMVSGTVFFSIA